MLYCLDRDLPHLVSTQQFLDELQREREHRHNIVDDPGPDAGHDVKQKTTTGTHELPSRIDKTAFENVTISYVIAEDALKDGSFAMERGEFVAFVGPAASANRR